MPKLSEYVEMAASDYLQETGNVELEPFWIAEYFLYSGVQDDYPRQDLVTFHALVQKTLRKKAERAGQDARRQLEKIARFAKQRHKP
ncbi:MAG: hypothetical protein H6R10_2234 [Rhodocyclaceae bacterium]|nr:hypothetical protein [Rhodocyclaceae bacterium]